MKRKEIEKKVEREKTNQKDEDRLNISTEAVRRKGRK